jgi:hypothetical protein
LHKCRKTTRAHGQNEATHKQYTRKRIIHSHLQHPKFVIKNYKAPPTDEAEGALCKAGKLNALEKQSAVGTTKAKVVFQGHIYFHIARSVGAIVQIALRVLIV